jgi:ribosome-associated protein
VALHGGQRTVRAGGAKITVLDAAQLAHRIVDTAADKKATDVVLLNVSELTSIADYFVICSGTSDRQVQAIAQSIVEAGEREGRRPIGVEGLSAARWVLVDFGDVIAHVFTPEERDYYRLERLWGDAPVVVRVQ